MALPGPAALPVPRTEVAGAAWNRMLAIVGGLEADGSASDRFDLYDVEGGRWRPGPSLPVPLHHAGMAVLGDRVYVAGGYSDEGGGWRPQRRVFSLGPGDTSWRAEPDLLVPRGALGLAAVGTRLVVVGGVTDAPTATTEVLALGERAWRPGPDLEQPREHLGVAVSRGRVYAVAGRVGGLETNIATVESWEPERESRWRPEPPLGTPRGGVAAADVEGTPCVAGGEAPSGTIESVECLEGGRWRTVARMRTPRHGLAVVAVGKDLHVVAGGPRPGLSVSGDHEVIRSIVR